VFSLEAYVLATWKQNVQLVQANLPLQVFFLGGWKVFFLSVYLDEFFSLKVQELFWVMVSNIFYFHPYLGQ